MYLGMCPHEAGLPALYTFSARHKSRAIAVSADLLLCPLKLLLRLSKQLLLTLSLQAT